MALGEIDYSLKPQELELFLAKPDRTIIAKLTEAFEKKQSFKLGGLNEITFSLPLVIDVNHELVRNKHVDTAKVRYLVKAKLGDITEWYRIEKINDDGAETEKKIYTLYSLGIELSDKQIRGYSETSINAEEALLDALSGTIWNTGYIDSDFLVKYRTFEIPQKSALDFVNQIAETFNALPIYDTTNRTVSLYNPANIGHDKGLKVSYGRYLKSINKEEDATQVVTRLKVYGADGMSIQRVNATGTTYIEDFSYFMYPFERDELGNVVKSSDYMSDGLCAAILDYNVLLTTKQTEFATLLSQKNTLQGTLTTKQNELATLQTELAIILDALDVAQSTGQPTATIIANRDAKLGQISTKQVEITTVQSSIATVDSNITTLRNTIALENNFTAPQITELNQFIVEREWADENYIDDQELYEAAREQLNELNVPQSTIRIDIVNFKEIVTEQHNWDKLNLGDWIYIYHERFNINVKARILEMNFEYDAANVDLLISNVVSATDDADIKLKNLLQQGASTSTTVNMNKFKWDGIEKTSNDVDVLLNSVWDAAARAISSGVNNSVDIGRRGITITDSADPLKGIRMVNGAIGISVDGFNTFATAMTGTGVIADRLLGRILISNNLYMENDSGKFSFTNDGATLTDASLTINHSTLPSRILMNATDGIKIQKDVTGTWTDRFSIDVDGDILFAGKLQGATGVFSGDVAIGTGNSIFKASSSGIQLGHATFTSAPFRVDMDGKLVATGAEISGKITLGAGSSVSWGYVTDAPSIPVLPGYIQSTYIDATTIESPTVKGGTIRIGNQSGNDTFIAGSSGIQLGHATFGSAPFRVDMNGALTATSATITGNINSSTFTGGTVTGSTVRTAASGTRVELTSGLADVRMFHNTNEIFRIEDAVAGGVNLYSPSGNAIYISGTIYAVGNWDFSGASTNIVAKFG